MLEIGSYLDGKYKILNKIGQGGMSVVYLAMNEKANKQWAVKEVRRDGIKDFKSVKQGLISETELLKKLNHPNLPSIIDIIEKDDTMLIVMDYIEGNPLSSMLLEYGILPQESVILWAKQLCDVLVYLHTREPPIIYRDMKPANIMLKPDGNITLVDFGTAREFKKDQPSDTACLGTIGYAAPEQFGGQGQTDVRTDIYCLGATLYHLLTGKTPSEPPYEIEPVLQINSSVSSGLARIIQKCTQRNPLDRYQSCAELMYALDHYTELDEIYIKRQKRKLALFMLSLLCTFIFSVSAFFSYTGAHAEQDRNYEITLIKAEDAQKTAEEREMFYLKAIVDINPANSDAYLKMLSFFLNDGGNETGSFSKRDAAVFTQLRAGVDRENSKGYIETVYPLTILKNANPDGYEKVCGEIGMAFWYDYEDENERYTNAVTWLEKAVHDPIAKLFLEIGQIHKDIKKYEGQKRSSDMIKSYGELLERLQQLNSAVSGSDDIDTKFLVWQEIVKTVSEKAGYLVKSADKNLLITLLDIISESLPKDIDDFRVEPISQSIIEAKLRVISA